MAQSGRLLVFRTAHANVVTPDVPTVKFLVILWKSLEELRIQESWWSLLVIFKLAM